MTGREKGSDETPQRPDPQDTNSTLTLNTHTTHGTHRLNNIKVERTPPLSAYGPDTHMSHAVICWH